MQSKPFTNATVVFTSFGVNIMEKQKADKQENIPLGLHFAALTKLYYGALTKRLEQLDLERYHTALLLIANSEDHCCQKDLGTQLDMDKASIVRVVDYLEQKGYIIRLVNPGDRREHHLALTEKGQTEISIIQQAVRDLNNHMLADMDARKRKELHQTLQLMMNNLQELPVNKISLKVKKKNSKSAA